MAACRWPLRCVSLIVPVLMTWHRLKFTGEYDKFFGEGVYNCAGCGTPLYKSVTKFDSGCGWPAFYEGLPGAINRSVSSALFFLKSYLNLNVLTNYLHLWLNFEKWKQWISARPRWEKNWDHMCSLWGALGSCFQRWRVQDSYRWTSLCQQHLNQVYSTKLILYLKIMKAVMMKGKRKKKTPVLTSYSSSYHLLWAIASKWQGWIINSNSVYGKILDGCPCLLFHGIFVLVILSNLVFLLW